MTWISKDLDKSRSVNFVAPDGMTNEKNEVLFPFHDLQEPAYAAALAVTVKQMDTFLQPDQLTGNVTINLTLDSQLTRGAKLHVKLSADGTQRTAALGTGFDADAADITVGANSTVFKTFVFDGVAFVPVA
jgi:hypothetical protein